MRKLRFWLLGAALLALALVVAFPLVGAYVVRSVVLPRLAQRTGTAIGVGDVTVRPTQVTLRRLRVSNADRPGSVDLLTVPAIEARFSPLSLLHGKLRLDEVRIDQAIIQVVRGDSEEDNISSVLARLQKRTKEAPDSAPAGGALLDGPRRIVMDGSVLDVRADAGSVHVAALSADLMPGQTSQIVLSDVSGDLVGGAVAQAQQVTLRFQTPPGHLLPKSLPEVEIEGGRVAPWKSLALTGIAGTITGEATGDGSGQDSGSSAGSSHGNVGVGQRATLKLHGGYGGVDRALWEASGWIRLGGVDETGARRDTEAALKLRADRFRLSSLDPILKNTPIIDSDGAQVDASLDLRYAQHALNFDGSFHMAGLSLFTPKLAAEPVRGLGIDLTARGRIDAKTRRFRLERSVLRWRGAEAVIEADAEAQPARLQVIGNEKSLAANALINEQRSAALRALNAQTPGPADPNAPNEGPGWRERWRKVTVHLQIPPLSCQSMLQSLPAEITPKIQGFRLGGTFTTDVRVAVDFAQLLRLPPAPPPGEDDEEGGLGLSDVPEAPRGKDRKDKRNRSTPAPAAAAATASAEPAAPPARHHHHGSHRRGVKLPPLRMPLGDQVAMPTDAATGAAGTGTALAGALPDLLAPPTVFDKDGVPQPVNLSGKIGIDGCKVLAAPADMNVENLLQSFTQMVEVEPGRFISFVIGPENPDFVPYEDISPYLINSIMTTEDNGFMKHHGFIAPEFRSALQQNLERGYFRLGASSITMQMIKNVLLSREKTLSRKLQEMFLTWYVEQNLTKERILEIYFNAIEFGPNLYGIGKAVRHYFGKTPKELTPREAAWFSSILPNPKRRYVHFCKGAPDAKWELYLNRILRRVHERGRLTDDEFNASMEERFTFNREEALPEKECLALIKRMTTPPPPPPPSPFGP